MERISKRKGIYGFALISVSCLTAAFAINASEKTISVNANVGNVPTAENFCLRDGAGLWIGNATDSGIRFRVDVKESYIKSFKDVESIKYWTIVAPAENVTDASELTVDNYAEKDGDIINASQSPSFKEDDNTDETFTYSADIRYNFSDTSYWTDERQQALIDLPLVARPCLAITYEDGTYKYVYANLDGTKSQKMRDVAERAMLAQASGSDPTTYNEEKLNKILWYLEAEDTNAYHDSVDATTLAFVDDTKHQGYEVYAKTVDNAGETNEVAKFTKIGSFEAGETVTLTGNIFAETEVGATTDIYLSNGTDFVKTSVTEVTQIIYDAEDLQRFNFTSAGITYKGTYVVANDIVDTETKYNRTFYDSCFEGLFDGLGHSLTFTTYQGLFGRISGSSNGGVAIRNVNFKNCTILKENDTYQTSLLGLSKDTAPIYLQNLSVSLSDETYTNLTSVAGKNSRILMYDASTAANTIVCQNVMIKFDYSKLPTADETAAKNIYVVSKLRTGTSNFNVVALNYDETKTYARSLELIETNLDVGTASSNVTKYNSYEALKEYYETEEGKAALATFDTAYWDVTTKGFPILGYNALDWVEDLGTGMFSGWDDNATGYDVDTDGDNQVLPFNIDGTVTGVYLKENVSTDADLTEENNLYANGKVNITNTSTRAIEYKTILIQTAEGKLYEARLEVYTRIINSEEDLRMFDLDSATNGRFLKGYYALGSDIVDNEEVYNSVNCGTSYFEGVFDGKGHSLTFTTVGGLFGKIQGATYMAIKNVNFKDCTITQNTQYGHAQTLIGYLSDSSRFNLQNLSISLSEQTYQNFKDDSAPDLYVVAYDNIQTVHFINCTNVMVEIDYSKIPTAETTSETKFITIISKLRNGTSNFNVVALNYDDTKMYARSVKLLDVTEIADGSLGSVAVTKYDSYEALKEHYETAENGATELATFDTTYWDVSKGYPVWKEQN